MASALHIESDGPLDGPSLVFVNSIGLDAGMWRPQVAAAPRGLRTVTYDQRGHGRSAAPAGPYSIAELGGDLVALLDSLHIERASVCGLSLGGMVAIWLAAHHPERVERLIVSCTSALPGDPEKWRSRSVTVREGGMRAFVRNTKRGWFKPDFATAHPGLVADLEEVLANTSAEGYASSCAAIENLDLRPELGTIVAPTLVIAGGADLGFPVDHSEVIRDGISGSTLTVIENAAHLANLEATEAFNTALFGFLDAPVAAA